MVLSGRFMTVLSYDVKLNHILMSHLVRHIKTLSNMNKGYINAFNYFSMYVCNALLFYLKMDFYKKFVFVYYSISITQSTTLFFCNIIAIILQYKRMCRTQKWKLFFYVITANGSHVGTLV